MEKFKELGPTQSQMAEHRIRDIAAQVTGARLTRCKERDGRENDELRKGGVVSGSSSKRNHKRKCRCKGKGKRKSQRK